MLQQAFISSIVQKVNSQGILGNVSQLLKIADIATKALTVDQGLDSVPELHAAAATSRSFSATSLSSPGFVQARNAGASICSGLPQANRNSGSPP
jgi:hypothetical protein